MENPNWLTRQNTSLCLMKEAAFQADTEKEIQKGNTDIFSQVSKGKYLEKLIKQGTDTYKCGKL